MTWYWLFWYWLKPHNVLVSEYLLRSMMYRGDVNMHLWHPITNGIISCCSSNSKRSEDNRSSLPCCLLVHHGEVSTQRWYVSWYHVVWTDQSALAIVRRKVRKCPKVVFVFHHSQHKLIMFYWYWILNSMVVACVYYHCSMVFMSFNSSIVGAVYKCTNNARPW